MANKNVIYVLVITYLMIVVLSCKTAINNNTNDFVKYRIVKIDSISDVYIIYAKCQSKYFKIVSKKTNDSNLVCNKIKNGNVYKFSLTSLFVDRDKFRTNFDGVDFNNQTIKLERDSITDVYTSNELLGLCYKKTR